MQQQEAQTQETISNLEKQTRETRDAITALQGQREQTQSNVNNLQNQSSSLQSTIKGYSNKLDSLNKEISDAEDKMAEVSAQIVDLNGQLQEAEEMERDRYELLKKRLQSTYESGGTSGLARILLESGSLSDFLTKFEYLDAIIRYDRKKISEYKDLQSSIKLKKAEVEEKEAELDAYQDQLDEKHDELSSLTDTVKSQLNSTNSSLSNEKNKLADYENQLANLDQKMKALESQVAAAQAELAKQIAERLALTREDTSGSYSASDTELAWLAATIQAEAGGESYTGKLAVGSVIMNRVKSSAFPNTVIAVITQNMQFASYRSGKVELIINNGPNSTCMRAAQEVLDGARVGDYLFFMTKYWADYYGIAEYTMIGNHAFFYRWITIPKPEPEPQPEPQPEPEPAGEDGGSQQEQGGEDNGSENSEGNSGEGSGENGG
ncbi:cell wall hydrolase [Butyrivibrio sp. FCS014]|uniref:cell wall hydrolase n=1 Tax=Butyrivibrio sp. FCS014 TaxID=1408304 RepID=UPI000466EF88|nr:cell wall hydrolase [Butyrivibrio sp. FCS014]